MIRMSPVTRLSLPGPLEGGGGRWYFSRKEIEENSPSRRDGISLKKENYLRKTYCTFLRDLGKKLKVPQVTIATAMIFCHRFYLRQSHAKNDRGTIATACMFLAGKVEETPRPLKDVILVSFEIINKNDQAAVHKIKQKEVYEQQKELILLAERVVLATLGFDMNVLHPYKPLVDAIRKYKVDQKELVKVAWNFVNDGLWTSLCLQFKPHHIAAAAIFLAAKFLKVKLPSDGEKVSWQEFDITPRQLQEVSNQMLELYEQNRVPASQAIEADGGIVGGAADKGTSKVSTEDQIVHANTSLAGGLSKSGAFERPSNHLGPESVVCLPKSARNCSSDYRSAMTDTPNKEHEECKVSGPSSHHEDVEGYHHITGGSDWGDANDDKQRGYNRSHKCSIQGKESAAMKSTPEALKKFDEDKLKQLQEKRKKSRGDAVRRTDMMDELDPIVKELEEGVELAAAVAAAAESDKSKHQFGTKGQLHEELDMGSLEEHELSASENSNGGNRHSPTDQKKKLEKQWHDYTEDSRNRLSRHGHTDRDKERVQENHV